MKDESRNGVRTIIGVIIFLSAVVCLARTITREEALHQAFAGSEIQSTMIFLTDQQLKEASAKAGNPIQSPLIARYTALSNGVVVGRAYLDSHVVRTKKERLLIMLNADGTVKRVEVVAFDEPPEYQPVQKWYDQFQGKSLSPDLSLKGQIRPVTGASLTSRATIEAVRRALAIDAVLQEKQVEKRQ
jgi:Na+-translocating ferredoxin:NAD+ oxidoreductase RnfG subunit